MSATLCSLIAGNLLSAWCTLSLSATRPHTTFAHIYYTYYYLLLYLVGIVMLYRIWCAVVSQLDSLDLQRSPSIQTNKISYSHRCWSEAGGSFSPFKSLALWAHVSPFFSFLGKLPTNDYLFGIDSHPLYRHWSAWLCAEPPSLQFSFLTWLPNLCTFRVFQHICEDRIVSVMQGGSLQKSYCLKCSFVSGTLWALRLSALVS